MEEEAVMGVEEIPTQELPDKATQQNVRPPSKLISIPVTKNVFADWWTKTSP